LPPACSTVSTVSNALLPVRGCKSVGMPRPSSVTLTQPPGWSSTSTVVAKPAWASSTELSTTSETRWCSPRCPVVPMYIPGRLRTGSSPSSTVICEASYAPASAESRACSAVAAARKVREATGPAAIARPAAVGLQAPRTRYSRCTARRMLLDISGGSRLHLIQASKQAKAVRGRVVQSLLHHSFLIRTYVRTLLSLIGAGRPRTASIELSRFSHI
jgi:hypothetical protein